MLENKKASSRAPRREDAEAERERWMREPRCGGHRHLPGDITDLELSGAAQVPTREADRRRPTRPLERLVRPQGNHAEKASTKPTERRCNPKLELGAKDRVAEVNAGGPRSPVRVRMPGTTARSSSRCRRQGATSGDEAATAGCKQKEKLRGRSC